MLSLKCLKTTKYDIVTPLSGFISPNLPPSNKQGIITDLKKIMGYREAFRTVVQYSDDNCLNTAKVYLDGLLSITKYFPVVADTVRSSITWYSSVNPKQKISTKSFLVEAMCTLFNIAALYSQKAVDSLPSELTISVIDEACADLKLANGYLAAIQQELSHMCDEEAKLPEINPEAILGYRSLLSAQLHYLKAEKAKILRPESRRLFTTVYMGSHVRYDEALKHFRLSASPLPDDFIHFVQVMSKVAYSAALYYEGYMTQEELEDFDVHGSGKAYFCITKCYDMLREIRQSRVPGVAQRVVPLLAPFTLQVTESVKDVMAAWQLRRSMVPNNDSSFNMRASFLPDATLPPLTPSVDFSAILTDSERQQFAALSDAYAKYCASALSAMDESVQSMERSVEENLYAIQYHPIVEAASCKEGVAEYYDSLLRQLYEKEKKTPLDEVIARYHQKREELKRVMEDCDCEYNNVVRLMGLAPNRFTPAITNYLRNTLPQSIASNKRFVTTLDATEEKLKPWLEVKDSKVFSLVAEGNGAVVRQRISIPVDVEDDLSDVNKTANTKTELDDLRQRVAELKATAHHMAALHYKLTAAFFTNAAGRSSLSEAFPTFFMDCQNVIATCQQQAKTWNDYIVKLQTMLNCLKVRLMGVSHYKEKFGILDTLSLDDKAYHELERYAEYTDKCEQSIKVFDACINIIRSYSNCSVSCTLMIMVCWLGWRRGKKRE
ncbi:hypothetical protein BLSTO_03147 [Blastocystis sp. subtype 1]